MLDLIWSLIQPIAGELAVLVVILGGIFGVWKKASSDGAAKEKLKAERADHETADDIRRRVERDRAQRVRDLDGAGYRD